MVSEAQRRASAKYKREKMKQVSLRFSPNEMDLYEFLRSHDNVAGYLKGLIRRDMEEAERD